MSDLSTPLARVKGLGSAKEGVTHWWRQRLTALLMVPLVLLLVVCVASLPSADHARFTAWISSPFATICLVLWIGAMFYHAQLGLQVIIEDYVSSHARRTAAIILVSFVCLIAAAVGIFSVLKIALGA
ncbi:MAG: succinate dehydrogenase, hydrophobic membrane anchor protein [Pseudomonadota bacterium]